MSLVDTPRRNATENVPAAVLALGALVLIAGGVLGAMWMLHPLIRKWDLGDLAVYRASGRAVLHGQSVFGAYVHDQLRVPLPFIYPPIAAALFAPFSWLGQTQANLAWTALTIVVLAAVVHVCFASLLRRFGRAAPIAFVVTLTATAALSPVEDHLRFGQVGIMLMACCIFDCTVERPRWPRGALIGIATAVKLVPGIFIPYLWLTGRRRAAGVATATFGAMTLLGVITSPGDSWDFFHSKMFAPTSPEFFTNQSIEGLLQRAVGGPWRILWLVAVVVVLVYGMRAALDAHRIGDELRAVTITGLVSVLVSPISWIHHLVWVIPALAVIIGSGRDRRKVAIAFLVAALFVARLPYFGHDELKTGLLAALLKDSYGFVSIALLVYLARGPRSARRDRDEDPEPVEPEPVSA
ncbi:MAG: alpha,2-mannosyltransferase [Actinomycetota bacterium]|nr:alpha,2-mannosyltransferase [Actinomycetota bacterium]